jgi:hypothetical protein
MNNISFPIIRKIEDGKYKIVIAELSADSPEYIVAGFIPNDAGNSYVKYFLRVNNLEKANALFEELMEKYDLREVVEDVS